MEKDITKKYLTLLLLLTTTAAFGNSDTTFLYVNKSSGQVPKDSASFLAKVVQEGSVWHSFFYKKNTDTLARDGYYEDNKLSKAHGPIRYYSDKGQVSDSDYYEHGIIKAYYSYYENRKVKEFAYFNDKGTTTKEGGYTEDGKVIPGYIYQHRPEFPGGDKAWIAYLQDALVKKLPKAYYKGKMAGTVIMTFCVDKEGKIVDVLVDTSSGFPELDAHATKVIQNGPDWISAIQHNRKVKCCQKQSLTYAPPVEER